MLKRTIAAFVVAGLAIAPASADTAKDIDTCLAAMAEKAPEATFTFERKSGASLVKLRFEMETTDGEKKDVVCKVRRGEIVDIEMGE